MSRSSSSPSCDSFLSANESNDDSESCYVDADGVSASCDTDDGDSTMHRFYSNSSAMHSMRSRANSVDAEVVTTFVESIERVATARRLTEADPAAMRAATKGIENLKKEVEMVSEKKNVQCVPSGD